MDAKEIRKRKIELKRVSNALKAKFVGIDRIIDQIIDNITVWYVTPEILTRPVIVNLWGLTGVGKTDLIRTLVKEINFIDNFVEIQLTNKASARSETSIESVLGDSSIETHKPGILLLDEIQRFRTIDSSGVEIDDYKFADIWMLLSDGKFSGSHRRKEDLLDILFSSMYYKQMDEENDEQQKIDAAKNLTVAAGVNAPVDTPVPSVKSVQRKYQQHYWDARRIKRMLKLEEDIPSIMQWDYDKKEKIIHEALSDNDVTEGESYSNLLIFISGNLDEAYAMSGETADSDIDADIFHAHSLKIDIIKIKSALSKRFKPEQISRFGNTHIVYPSLSKDSYQKIIREKMKSIADFIKDSNNIAIYFDETVTEFIYRNGVFPAQGVRPVLSTIVAYIENTLPFFLLTAIEKKENKVLVAYNAKTKSLVATIGSVVKKHKMNGVIDEIKEQINLEWQTIVSVHEAGHAIVYGLLFGFAPTQIKSKTNLSGGFIAHHDIIPTKESLMDHVVTTLAGQAAEEIVFGEGMKSGGCASDLDIATQMVAQFVRVYGMDGYQSQIRNGNAIIDSMCNFNIDQTNDSIEEIMKAQKERAVGLLQGNQNVLKDVSSALIDAEDLSPDDFKKILEKHNVKVTIRPIKQKVIKGYTKKFKEWRETIS